MKKILYLLFLGLTVQVNSFDLKVPLNQKFIKANMVFSNGKTYQNLEDDLCVKFSNLPEFIIICGYGLEEEALEGQIVNPSYCPNYCRVSYTVLKFINNQ